MVLSCWKFYLTQNLYHNLNKTMYAVLICVSNMLEHDHWRHQNKKKKLHSHAMRRYKKSKVTCSTINARRKEVYAPQHQAQNEHHQKSGYWHYEIQRHCKWSKQYYLMLQQWQPEYNTNSITSKRESAMKVFGPCSREGYSQRRHWRELGVLSTKCAYFTGYTYLRTPK